MRSHPPLTRRFQRDRRGGVALMFGLALPVLAMLAGGALDYTNAVRARTKLQELADIAALAGATALANGTPPGQAKSEAAKFVIEPLLTVSSDVTPSATSMTVQLRADSPAYFLKLLGRESLPVSARAVARVRSQGAPVCMNALDASQSKALLGSGGSELDAGPCVVWVNSSSSGAVELSGGSSLAASKACIVGGVAQGLSNIVAAPENCGVRADPFAGLNPTTPANCSHTNFSGSGVVTLNPGVYCGGINLSGGPTVKLNPGTYVIRDGKFTQSGGGSMTGDGVVFVIEGASEVNLSGGGAYHLTAPKTGELAGFLFFQRPNANPGKKANMSGGGELYYEGVVYFPTQQVLVSGGGATTTPSPFTAYIDDSFTYTGGSTFRIDYDPTKITVPIPDGLFSGAGAVYLAE